jgi:hypothetical protein
MTRYFFHLEAKSDVLLDDAGAEFGNIEEVKAHAFQVARELARKQPNGAAQSLLVIDAAGVVLFRVPLIDHG